MKQFLALMLIAAHVSAYGQQRWHWKEYVYERDGFAITLPLTPEPHSDPNLPSATVYTVHFSADDALSIRALQDPRPCADTLGTLKSGALGGKQPGVDLASVKEITVAGYPGVEYSTRNAGRNTFERYVCANGSYYIFTARWPSGQPRPAAFTRIVESLRLLGTGAAPSDYVQTPFAPGETRPDTGEISGREYRNRFFGFTYPLPDGSTRASQPPEAAKLMDERSSFELLAGSGGLGDGGKLGSTFDITAWSARTLWWKDWHGKTGGDYLTKVRTVLPPDDRNWKAVGPVREKKINGRTFYEADAVSSHANVEGFQSQIATVEHGFVLRFIFEAGTQEELDRLLASLNSLQFAEHSRESR
jgi:hypothetical protein